MSTTSDWPLPPDSLRYVLPQRLVQLLQKHPLTRDIYPLSFGHYRRARGHRMHRDRHDDELLIYCTEGEAVLTTGNQKIQVEAGDLLLLPSGEAHRYATPDANPWTIYWIHYSGPLAPYFRQYLGFSGQTRRLHLGRQPRLLVDFNGLLSVQDSGFREQPLIHAANRLRQLLTALPLSHSGIQPKQQTELDLDELHQQMRQNLEGRLDLDSLAATAGLSRYHFIARYKQMTGQTPIQHYLHMKIERACYLLDSGESSIRSIAEQLGYEDSYYFSRLFKKVMGVSPANYRRVNRY
ncbi:AraC family transcriptional regulator [Marinospirillum perlucidum]|uniref:AraC family transcriptional regulator n=1 Tax=Marinospirillum perlucidum TaxID=1982602 RepID=UPI000DF477B9|nr:AraC family transcriptional regulator [Marinospirillum perlucidum]